MKLATEIKPRKDGTVISLVPATDRAPAVMVVFSQEESGRLVAEVEHDDHIGFLLDSGNFFPVEEADIQIGLKVASAPGDDSESSRAISVRQKRKRKARE